MAHSHSARAQVYFVLSASNLGRVAGRGKGLRQRPARDPKGGLLAGPFCLYGREMGMACRATAHLFQIHWACPGEFSRHYTCRKPIHLPKVFYQHTFQCLRFVQTITALGSTSNPNLFSLPTFSPHRPHRRRPVRCPAPAPRSVAVHTRHAATRRKRRRLPRALLPAPPPPPARCAAAARAAAAADEEAP